MDKCTFAIKNYYYYFLFKKIIKIYMSILTYINSTIVSTYAFAFFISFFMCKNSSNNKLLVINMNVFHEFYLDY